MSSGANKEQDKYEGIIPPKDAAGFQEKEDLEWEEIRMEHIVQDEWIDFRKSAYRFPDGRVFEPFYSYSRRDYVVVVASDEDGKYLCVRQFRQGIKKVTTEFPAGGIERKDGREYRSECAGAVSGDAAEDALEAAKRELLEETGYVSDAWRHVLTVPSNATIADNYAYIFVAEHCRKAGEQHLDEMEWLNVRKYSAAEIEGMIEEGEFPQAVHIMAWLLSQRKSRCAYLSEAGKEEARKLLAEYNLADKDLMERFEFRTIRPEEVDQAVAIEQICFPPNEACSEKNMTDRIAKAPELFLVAVDRETGKLAGFLNGLSTDEYIFRDEFFTDAELYRPDGKNIMLLGLDVLPEYRRQGLAKELVFQYLRHERECGRKMVFLTCLKEKVKMYKRMGFVDKGIANSTWGGEEWHEMFYRIGF